MTVEGNSLNVLEFKVWNSSPPGGGVEFSLVIDGEPGFLSLRSTNSMYGTTNVPTAFDVAAFDNLAEIVRLHIGGGTDPIDDGSIDTITQDATAPLTFNFSGVVGSNQLGSLFPDMSVGEVYSGSFTVDPAAAVVHRGTDATFYDGSSFDLTIAGVSHSVSEFRVWNSSVTGGGVEFVFTAGGETAFLSLRSTGALYAGTEVPTEFDIADFNDLARAQQSISRYMALAAGSIDTIVLIPEPTTGTLVTAILLAVSLLPRWSRTDAEAEPERPMVTSQPSMQTAVVYFDAPSRPHDAVIRR